MDKILLQRHILEVLVIAYFSLFHPNHHFSSCCLWLYMATSVHNIATTNPQLSAVVSSATRIRDTCWCRVYKSTFSVLPSIPKE